MRFIVLILAGVTIAMLDNTSSAQACGVKRYCKQMSNCAEASYYLEACGLGRLDRDKDGIPCESICGKNLPTYQRRVAVQTAGKGIALFATAGGLAIGQLTAPNTKARARPILPSRKPADTRVLFAQTEGNQSAGTRSPKATTFTCGNKRYCKQMSSCAEAKFYLAKCGARRLDGNRDGIPCNRLCR